MLLLGSFDCLFHLLLWQREEKICNSILLHSGLDADWQFWLSARFSVDYKWNQVRMFWKICENNFLDFQDMKASRKMFKNVWIDTSKFYNYFFHFCATQKKTKNRFVCWNQSTMQHDALLHFGWFYLKWGSRVFLLFDCLHIM